MGVRDTSLEAYHSLEQLNNKQKIVLEVIKRRQPCTDQQIASALGWPINRVTPRRGELEKANMIIDGGKIMTSSGRKAHVWKIRPKDGEQMSIAL